MAHEAAHTVQQGMAGPSIQREVVIGSASDPAVDRAADAVMAGERVAMSSVGQRGGPAVQRTLSIDTARSDDPPTAVGTIKPLVAKLCGDFDVAASGAVTSNAGKDCAKFNFGAVAKGAHPLGRCCLCTLVKAPDAWSIIVTNTDAPTTDSAGRTVRFPRVGAPGAPTFRYWSTGAGGAAQTMVDLPPEEAFGHELCGHGALMQIKAPPPSGNPAQDRAFSDVHDPTAKVENALATEMGLGGAGWPAAAATAASRCACLWPSRSGWGATIRRRYPPT